MSNAGKGSARRLSQVSNKELAESWARVFGKSVKKGLKLTATIKSGERK